MKTLLVVLSISVMALASQARAEMPGSVRGTLLISLSPLITSVGLSGGFHKEARQILADGQEYIQTGEMSLLLTQKIETLQDEEPMSDEDAFDVLMNLAKENL